MSDITKEPYAKWLEAALRGLVDLHPKSIGITAILPDGMTATNYFEVDNHDRVTMCEAIMVDYLSELIRVNAPSIKAILDSAEEEEEEEPE